MLSATTSANSAMASVNAKPRITRPNTACAAPGLRIAPAT
jgi:hypothetical protein